MSTVKEANTINNAQSPGSSQKTSANTAFELGQEAWQHWEKNEDLEALSRAFEHYKHAWQLDNHNSSYQHAYYLSWVYHSFYTETVDETALLALYNSMQTAIRLDVPPPARVSYALANSKGQSPQILRSHAQRAIKQQPKDALSWKQLSEQYLKLQQPELAANSAQRALTLDEEDNDYRWQLAESLAALSQLHACEVDSENTLLLAASHSARAATRTESPAWRLANSSEKYLALGLLPLAEHQVMRSMAMESNAANIASYIKLALVEGRDFQTEAFVEKAENTLHNKSSYIALAMASAANGNWRYAEEFMTMAKSQQNFDLIDHSIYYWLAQLAYNVSGHLALIEMSAAENAEERAIKNWLTQSNSPIDFGSVFKQKNTCTQLKEDFYQAFHLWAKGDVPMAKEKLRAAANADFYNTRERIWAVAILEGLQK